MKDTIPTPADIGQIARWMEAAGIDDFELTGGGQDRLRISLSGGRSIAPGLPPPPDQDRLAVTAPYFGVLTLAAHLIDALPVQVREGDVIGHLELGSLTVPIIAPRDARVVEILAETGRLIGYGAPVVSMVSP